MKKLKEIISEAREEKKAVGHFNISTVDGLWAIFNSARKLDLPVIIGASEGERDFLGVKQTVALVKSIREEYDYPIFLNADHTYSFDRVKEAIDAGFDSVIFDGAKLSLEENIKITKQCVDYARNISPDIVVEGELGYIGGSSMILDAIPEGAAVGETNLTTVEQAREYVSRTGVDLFSPAVGSIHGMLRETKDPDLDMKRIADIAMAVDAPLVLHGGSGLTDDNFRYSITAGISVVHVNTELRVAWRDSVKISLQENPDELAPYKISKNSIQAISKVVEQKLSLFNREK